MTVAEGLRTVAAPPTSTPAPLAGVRRLFADSRLELAYARQMGLPPDALVRTRSPDLAAAGEPGVEATDRRFGPEHVMEMDAATLSFTAALHDALAAVPVVADLALPVAQMALNFQTLIYHATALTEEDYTEPTGVVSLALASRRLERVYTMPWDALLTPNPRLVRLTVPPELIPPEQPLGHETAPLWMRLRFEDWQSIGYRLFTHLWRRLPRPGPRGSVLVYRENSLLKEAAFHLALWGFSIKALPVEEAPSQPLAPAEDRALEAALAAPLETHLAARLTPSAVAPMRALFLTRARECAGRYRAAVALWRERLEALASLRPRAVLVNLYTTPEMNALFRVCRERGILLAAFQHGISREINSRITNAQAYYENNLADLFYTYNHRAAEESNANRFAAGRAVAVGMPADLRRIGRLRLARKDTPPVLYASTAIYLGTLQLLQTGGPDHAKAAWETRLVDEVFARLPHRVLYKSNPARRYLDPDPAVARARVTPNVEVYDGLLDLRYMLPGARVVVTSRGTSTLSWCLCADRPLVFIDLPHSLPLRPEVREALSRAVFLFDGGDDDVLRRLRAFLSRPLAEIEAAWMEKAGARREVVRHFMDSGGPGAGRRAAGHLVDFLRRRGRV